MQSKLVFKLTDLLFKYSFSIYKPLYFSFKKKQDAFEIELFKKYIKKGDTVLDIGANIGFYSEILSSLVGSHGMVHAFEPDKKNFSHLKKITGKLNNIKINNFAVSDKNGTLELYISKFLNVDHRTYPHNDAVKKITIPTESIDNYVNGKFKVDLVKMDIQGAEYFAFKGMEKTIAENKDIIIITEIFPFGLKGANTSVEKLFEWFKIQEFNLYQISENAILPFPDDQVLKYNSYKEYDFDNIILSKNKLI